MSQCSQPSSCLCSASCEQPKRKEEKESSRYNAGSWLQPHGCWRVPCPILVPSYPILFHLHPLHSISIHPIRFHLIPSPSIPPRPIPSHPHPSHSISVHPIPSHPLPSTPFNPHPISIPSPSHPSRARTAAPKGFVVLEVKKIPREEREEGEEKQTSKEKGVQSDL